jgi:hypothetical protein
VFTILKRLGTRPEFDRGVRITAERRHAYASSLLLVQVLGWIGRRRIESGRPAVLLTPGVLDWCRRQSVDGLLSTVSWKSADGLAGRSGEPPAAWARSPELASHCRSFDAFVTTAEEQAGVDAQWGRLAQLMREHGAMIVLDCADSDRRTHLEAIVRGRDTRTIGAEMRRFKAVLQDRWSCVFGKVRRRLTRQHHAEQNRLHVAELME